MTEGIVHLQVRRWNIQPLGIEESWLRFVFDCSGADMQIVLTCICRCWNVMSGEVWVAEVKAEAVCYLGVPDLPVDIAL